MSADQISRASSPKLAYPGINTIYVRDTNDKVFIIAPENSARSPWCRICRNTFEIRSGIAICAHCNVSYPIVIIATPCDYMPPELDRALNEAADFAVETQYLLSSL